MKCPNCGAEIKRFDLSPNCKSCGVHIMYFTQEEDLRRDAKKTELEFTSARLLLAKIKGAYIKGKIPVMRIIFTVLSIASLLLPHYNISLSFPWWDYEISIGAFGVYHIIADSFWQIFDALSGVGVGNALFVLMLCSFGFLIAAALATAVCVAALFLAFINIKKTAKVMAFGSVAAIVFQLTGTVISFIALNVSGTIEFVSVKPLFGGIVSAVIFAVLFTLNLLLVLHEPEIPIREADLKRLEIKKKLKNGEISLDELSLPIVEEDVSEVSDEKKKRGKKK